ncbi:DHH family phosphoesterase [Oceanobacillus chungangensis]|uniref:DHH family phosphoesterase n=1 Tax=Oceanobacillus chungangensis TaxID=1229152 RepID=A0A3D8PZH4_9BACI|nr:bifunctional oligoribonuclease/PAP phosphatase NrnA [Oceanobacillus chungangensis]RDW21576.1 DHH family phosphoesterase [Oceanobacillus chungangensis]
MSKAEIIENLKQYDTIIIHRHVRPDPDALGSQVGLKEIIKASFPNKSVYAVGEQEASLEFLAKMDVIADESYEQALVIVCDTANSPRIDDERYQLGKKLIKIDHHPVVDEYGDVRWENTNSSSASEMIYELYEYGKDQGLKMSDEAARLLYGGIVGDTGRFMFPSTTKKTFQYAAELVTYNFDRTELYKNLYMEKDSLSRLKGYILQNFKLTPAGSSTIKLPKEILEKFNVTPRDPGKIINVLGDVEGIKAWAFFTEEDDSIRVSIRSKGPVINQLAAKYNGGGHPLASGAQAASWNDVDNIIADLEALCKEN